MALTHHDDLEFVAGDDWSIDGTLLDVNGSPLDLTNATFLWNLIDPNGLSVSDLVGASAIGIIQPSTNGQVQIIVPKQFTAPLLAGRFHDALRVTIGYSSTFWMGTILVNGDPFGMMPPLVPGLDSLDLTSGIAGFGTPTLGVH